MFKCKSGNEQSYNLFADEDRFSGDVVFMIEHAAIACRDGRVQRDLGQRDIMKS